MQRATALLVACVFGLVLSLSASAQQPVRADIDYRVIKPQPVALADRIEVIDFFWYGCPHCNNLQPALERWISRKPADVVIRRIPAILRESWAPHARIYYTLEALGEAERAFITPWKRWAKPSVCISASITATMSRNCT